MAAKKQIPLRLSEKLYADIAAWAEDDFRSVNGQIEYLLSECVRQRKKMENMSRRRSMFHRNWISNDMRQGDTLQDKNNVLKGGGNYDEKLHYTQAEDC